MDDQFIREWLDLPSHDPDALSSYTVINDRWDRKYVGQMLESVSDFLLNHEMLVDKIETGSPMWSDLFWLLWKYEPEMFESGKVKPSHLINYLVGEEMGDLADFRRLKFFAEGDDVASALACIDLREVLEQLFDKMKQLREKLQQIMDEMRQLHKAEQEERDLDEMIEQWRNGMNPDLPDPESPEGEQQGQDFQKQKQNIQQTIDELQEALNKSGEELGEEAHAARPVISNGLKDQMKEAADNAEAVHNSSDLFGSEDGSLQRMPAEERMELARKLQNRKFKHLLDLIGPMRRIMEEAQMRRVDYARDEVHRITMGDDLPRVLPSELAKLHHPLLKLDFKRRFLEKELTQYELRGKEKVGKGEIIACIDTSGSMHGDKEMWAKACGVCALHLSRKQKRGFYGILFSSANQVKTYDFGLDVRFSPQQVIDFAETNFFGGTDFMRPLSLALDRLRAEHKETGKVQGDIMFITDGIAHVDSAWLEMFKAEQKRLEFKVWGFLIGGHGKETEPLWTITDGQVFTVQDLLDPSQTRTMFGAI